MMLSSVCIRDTSATVVLYGGKPRNPQCLICILIKHFMKGCKVRVRRNVSHSYMNQQGCPALVEPRDIAAKLQTHLRCNANIAQAILKIFGRNGAVNVQSCLGGCRLLSLLQYAVQSHVRTHSLRCGPNSFMQSCSKTGQVISWLW